MWYGRKTNEKKTYWCKYDVLCCVFVFIEQLKHYWTGCLDDMVECRMTKSAHAEFYVAA